MILSIVAAMTENRVIGRNGAMPWDLPDDRRRFRELTMGHAIIMGRKTFEAIGHPLPGRRNIVLTRQIHYRAKGCDLAHDFRSALERCEGSTEVFIIGGGEVYREALPYAERIYLTIVHADVAGDVLFPQLASGEFRETERREAGGDLPCTYLLLTRQGRPLSWRQGVVAGRGLK
jgi:dihydrofolate reductase